MKLSGKRIAVEATAVELVKFAESENKTRRINGELNEDVEIPRKNQEVPQITTREEKGTEELGAEKDQKDAEKDFAEKDLDSSVSDSESVQLVDNSEWREKNLELRDAEKDPEKHAEKDVGFSRSDSESVQLLDDSEWKQEDAELKNGVERYDAEKDFAEKDLAEKDDAEKDLNFSKSDSESVQLLDDSGVDLNAEVKDYNAEKDAEKDAKIVTETYAEKDAEKDFNSSKSDIDSDSSDSEWQGDIAGKRSKRGGVWTVRGEAARVYSSDWDAGTVHFLANSAPISRHFIGIFPDFWR
jgi:hypothetical protein